MDKNANLYDIDGELLRKSGETKKMTIDEAKDKAKYYQDKLDKLEDGDPKADIYKTYIKNLNTYALNMLINNPELLAEELKKNKTTEEEAEEALKQLITDIENDGSTERDIDDKVSEQPTGNNENTTDEEPGNASSIERNDGYIHEERPVTQSDLLVSREEVNTSMDEYQEFEEVK